jgi:hypothetical protein
MIPLNNGRVANLIGSGPPIVFSSGLYGICPHQAYSNVANLLSKNLTVVHVEGGVKFMSVDDIESVADALNVDKLGFFSHSSFDPDILESTRVKKAVLCDPIGTPKLSSILNFKFQPHVKTDIQVLQIKAEKLYNGKFELPTWNQWNIEGDVKSIFIDSGHVDLMDDSWVSIAKKIGFWEMLTPPSTNFQDFQFTRSDMKKIRSNYRKHLTKVSIDFFLNKGTI